MLDRARIKGARYRAVDEDVEMDSRGFWKRVRGEDLVSLKDLKNKDRRIVVFEIIYLKGDQ